MFAAGNLDWLYHLLGYTLAAAGLLLLLWALFWDRSRGRRRCPRCWYDMEGVPGLKCPECGREARSERGLQRVRRRWRFVFPVIFLWAGAYVLWSVPWYQARGWTGLVPSTYLVCFVRPPVDPNWRTGGSVAGSQPLPFARRAPFLPTRPTTPAAAPSLAEQLHKELWTRLNAGKLARWQSELFLNRFMKANAIDPGSFLKAPRTWPIGRDVPIQLSQRRLAGLDLHLAPPGSNAAAGWGTEVLMRGESTPCSGIDVEIRLMTDGGRAVYRATRRVPIDISENALAAPVTSIADR